MKATGIVRRIDDLGRVVIPKEIRRTLRIREGDPLEIFTDREGEIILKKYSPIGEFGMPVKLYAESLSQTMGCTVCITDTDQVIAVSGAGKKDLEEIEEHEPWNERLKRNVKAYYKRMINPGEFTSLTRQELEKIKNYFSTPAGWPASFALA